MDKAVRHGQAHLDALVEHTIVGVAQADARGRIVAVNPCWCEMIGYSEAELLQRSLADLTHPDDLSETMTKLQGLEAGAPGFRIDKRYLRKDGSTLWARSSVSALRDEAGGLQGVVAVVVDIGDRKRMEDALRAREARQAFLLKLGDALRPLAEPLEIQAEAARMLGERLEASRVHYVELELEGDAVVRRSHVRDVGDMAGRHRFEAFGPRLLDDYRAGRTLVVHDVARAPEFDAAARAAWAAHDIVAAVGVPLMKGGHLAAVLAVHHRRARAWSAEEVSLLEEAAARTWDAVERARAEEALRESDERLRIALEAADLGLWDLDLRTGSSPVRSLLHDRMFGYSEPQAEWGQQISERAVLPEDLPVYREAFRRAAETGTMACEVRVRWPDGSVHWISPRGRTYFDGAGRPVRMVGVVADISERKRAEEELRQREREFRTLADNTPDILARFDRELRHLFINKAVARATGMKPEQFLGKTNVELGLPADLCELWNSAVRAVLEQRQPQSIEFRIDRPSGPRHYLGRFVPEFAPSGEVEHVLGVVREQTAEKLAAEALQEADRRKDEFLATLAHELRNPLAPVRTGLQILRLSPADGPAATRTLAMMERQLSHIVRLIDDLLDVSRISLGKIELRRERLALRPVLDSAVEASRPLIDAGRHELTLHLPHEALHLDADPTRLSQVVSNLLNNAAKYTPENGRIDLSAQRDGNEVLIRVKDNGMGIPREMLPRVFEMFTQLARPGHTQGGLGIGLSLARRLVEMHRGTIEADSPGPGRGAVFTVCLPLLPAPEDKAAGLREDAPAASRGRRVLVVDDNVDAAETLAMMLDLMGHETRTAHGGAEALALMRAQRPAVVFCDIGMPGLDGYEVARRVRGDPALAGLRLVALTGWGSEEDKRQAREAGFDHHLTKPVEVSAIQQLFGEFPPLPA